MKATFVAMNKIRLEADNISETILLDNFFKHSANLKCTDARRLPGDYEDQVERIYIEGMEEL